MIDANHVDRPQRAAHALKPPAIILGRDRLPTVERIAPFLAIFAKIIRRHPRYFGRLAGRAELEDLAMRPGIGAVHGDKYRDIADELNPFAPGIIAQCLPLFAHQPLLEFDAPNLVGVGLARALKRCGIAADIFGWPIAPTSAVKLFFERHIKRKIGEPIGLGADKLIELAARLGGVFLAPALKCARQKRALLSLNFPKLTRAGGFA